MKTATRKNELPGGRRALGPNSLFVMATFVATCLVVIAFLLASLVLAIGMRFPAFDPYATENPIPLNSLFVTLPLLLSADGFLRSREGDELFDLTGRSKLRDLIRAAFLFILILGITGQLLTGVKSSSTAPEIMSRSEGPNPHESAELEFCSAAHELIQGTGSFATLSYVAFTWLIIYAFLMIENWRVLSAQDFEELESVYRDKLSVCSKRESKALAGENKKRNSLHAILLFSPEQGIWKRYIQLILAWFLEIASFALVCGWIAGNLEDRGWYYVPLLMPIWVWSAVVLKIIIDYWPLRELLGSEVLILGSVFAGVTSIFITGLSAWLMFETGDAGPLLFFLSGYALIILVVVGSYRVGFPKVLSQVVISCPSLNAHNNLTTAIEQFRGIGRADATGTVHFKRCRAPSCLWLLKNPSGYLLRSIAFKLVLNEKVRTQQLLEGVIAERQTLEFRNAFLLPTQDEVRTELVEFVRAQRVVGQTSERPVRRSRREI